ncbi:MAG: hypothetical protein C0423_01950 [Methylibium sp.]|nr:hypothetical protein [Methylibium sp.]
MSIKTYIVTRKSDGQKVYEYSHTEPVSWVGMEFGTHDHTEKVEVIEPAPGTRGPRRLTKQQFIDRLGDPAHKAILQMADASLDVRAFVHRFENLTPDPDGTSVDLDDPRTIAGVMAIGPALVAAGVVSADWAQGVLNG